MCYHFNAEGEFCIPWAQLSSELAQEKESHSESLAMYRSARDRAEQLKKENELLREALQEIALLDPSVDSDEGFNEWGEAHCFKLAQNKARAAVNLKD